MTYVDDYPYDDEDNDTCQRCGGAGFYHDCGEDICCCEDAGYDDFDNITCPDCGGTGVE